jgi:flagellar capping protein FliD
MIGSKYDIQMQQGTTYELLLSVKDSTGNNKNLAGHSASMQIRSTYQSQTATESLSTGTGEIDINTSNSTIHILLSAERTAAIRVDLSQNKIPPSSKYVYDLELTDSDNKVSKLIYGDVIVFGEVTR